MATYRITFIFRGEIETIEMESLDAPTAYLELRACVKPSWDDYFRILSIEVVQ